MLTAIDGQVNGGGGVDKFRIKSAYADQTERDHAARARRSAPGPDSGRDRVLRIMHHEQDRVCLVPIRVCPGTGFRDRNWSSFQVNNSRPKSTGSCGPANLIKRA
jgi:hypothetical protein